MGKQPMTVRIEDFFKKDVHLLLTENGSVFKEVDGVKIAKTPDNIIIAKMLFRIVSSTGRQVAFKEE
mgnify:FL=1|tara:strand:+ start:557 stop:757 length:201 start_codon:yes stop_codon:yes gene_type:complete